MWFIKASAGFSHTVICFLSVFAVNFWCLIFISSVVVIKYQFRIEYTPTWVLHFLMCEFVCQVHWASSMKHKQSEFVNHKMKMCFKFTQPSGYQRCWYIFLHQNRFGESLKLKNSTFVLQTAFRFIRCELIDWSHVFINFWTLILTAPIHCKESFGICLNSHIELDATVYIRLVCYTNYLHTFIQLGLHKWVALFIWKDQENIYRIF